MSACSDNANKYIRCFVTAVLQCESCSHMTLITGIDLLQDTLLPMPMSEQLRGCTTKPDRFAERMRSGLKPFIIPTYKHYKDVLIVSTFKYFAGLNYYISLWFWKKISINSKSMDTYRKCTHNPKMQQCLGFCSEKSQFLNFIEKEKKYRQWKSCTSSSLYGHPVHAIVGFPNSPHKMVKITFFVEQ